jgi:hypothetical protein
MYGFAAYPAELAPKGEHVLFLFTVHGGEFCFAGSSQSLEMAGTLWCVRCHLLVTGFC